MLISSLSKGRVSAFTWKWAKSKHHSTIRLEVEQTPRKIFLEENRSQNLRHVLCYFLTRKGLKLISFYDRKLALQQKPIRQYYLLSRSANSLIHQSTTSKERLIIKSWYLRKTDGLYCGGFFVLTEQMFFLPIERSWGRCVSRALISGGFWQNFDLIRRLANSLTSFDALSFLLRLNDRWIKVLDSQVCTNWRIPCLDP